MSTALGYSVKNCSTDLHNGDCMTQPEFHRLYEQTPEGFRAELIAGVVYVSEPIGSPHAGRHVRLATIFDTYSAATPGVEAYANASTILGPKDEVQPDLLLRVLPEYQGRSGDSPKDLYIHGGPELVAEVAYSSRAIDLHLKRERYANAGVQEYIVVCLKPARIYWFDLVTNCELSPDAKGIIRSNIFPGLWINGPALLKSDYNRSMSVLKRGLSSPQHVEFVAGLAVRRR